ncbi:MAG TPA: glycosyltransferase family 2 protein [Patescibacteria group bacterium]|nr:glycosyltransferase family 2 protein [Patescibacteria group bacterium]
MTNFFNKLFTHYPIRTQRFLEFFIGFTVWAIIFLPVYGSFFFPELLAYFILFFDIYWFFKSFHLVFTSYLGSRKIKEAEKENWAEKAMKLEHADEVTHVIVIPNYKENLSKLRFTLNALTTQTFPLKQLFVVLAMEERETNGREKANELINEFKTKFGGIFASYHPDVPGEVKGKSSNEAYGGRVAYQRLYANSKYDINYATVSSVDADAIFDKQFFAYLTHSFLTNPHRYRRFWQSANVYFNNLWKVPTPTRIISFFGSMYRIALLVQRDRLIVNATYTLSFKLLKEIDYWDVDVIPEDYRIFFKAFFKNRGNIWAEPIFLKTSMDGAQSSTYFKSLQNRYQQERRWAWGVSDDPLFIKWWLTVPNVPFYRKTSLLFDVLLDHMLWPVNWFIITIAANIMPFLNPVYSRTSLGYTLPKIAASILTVCLLAIIALIVINYRDNPEVKKLPWYRKVLFPLEFIVMPVTGFIFSALPALISHTQLMFGKRLEYKVTEKV